MSRDYTGATSHRTDLSTISTHRDISMGAYLAWIYLTASTAHHQVSLVDPIASAHRVQVQLGLAGTDVQVLVDLATTDLQARATLTNFAQYGTSKWLGLFLIWKTPTEAGGANTDQKIYIGDYATMVLGTGSPAEPSAYGVQTAGSGAMVATDATTFWKIGNGGNNNTSARGRIAYSTVIRRNGGTQVSVAEALRWFRHPQILPGCQFFFEIGAGPSATDRDLSNNGITATQTGTTIAAHPGLDPIRRIQQIRNPNPLVFYSKRDRRIRSRIISSRKGSQNVISPIFPMGGSPVISPTSSTVDSIIGSRRRIFV